MPSPHAKQLKETVKWAGLSEELFPKQGLLLAAVSGGADSMALLSILQQIGLELGFRVAVGHFDHGIRPTSGADRARVEKYARSLALPFYAGEGDVPAAARDNGETIEEAARKARYRFLLDLAQDIGAKRIATGHTRDDQVETVMMRVLRGTGIRGLAGIPIRRGRIVRPLLGIDRRDTVRYCEDLKIPLIVDESNADTAHMRNRIRLHLLPTLESDYHPAVRANLLRLSENAASVMRHVRAVTTPLIEQNLRAVSEGEWMLNISKFSSLDETSLFILFGDVFSESLGCDMDFARVHYEQLILLIKDSRGSGKELNIPGLTIKREYENLLITRSKASASVSSWDCQATLTLPGETRVAGLIVQTEILERTALTGQSVKAGERTACFALDRLKLPLVLRNTVQGDRMQPFGMQGSKKISDIFSDRKIPARQRPQSLVVADANDVLWLLGVTTHEKARIGEATDRIVRISVRGIEDTTSS